MGLESSEGYPKAEPKPEPMPHSPAPATIRGARSKGSSMGIGIDDVPTVAIKRLCGKVEQAKSKGYHGESLRSVLDAVAFAEWNSLQMKMGVSFSAKHLAAEIAKYGQDPKGYRKDADPQSTD